jgi:hypothetical protein
MNIFNILKPLIREQLVHIDLSLGSTLEINLGNQNVDFLQLLLEPFIKIK